MGRMRFTEGKARLRAAAAEREMALLRRVNDAMANRRASRRPDPRPAREHSTANRLRQVMNAYVPRGKNLSVVATLEFSSIIFRKRVTGLLVTHTLRPLRSYLPSGIYHA